MADTQGRARTFGGPLTRRRFLQAIGATAGSAAVMNVMSAWNMFGVAAQTTPPTLQGSGNGTKVIILGGGPGGCPMAYELKNAGYDVTVLEAKDHLGGHALTVRTGTTTHEYGGEEQTCTWETGMWYDAGPSRIPFYHQAVLHYCNVLNVPMTDHKNLDLNGYVYMENIPGPLNATRMRLHELQADMAGYTAELLAKAADQEKLDQQLTAEDRDMLIDYLANWGIISPKDLTYTGSRDNRGYSVLPGVNEPGEIGPPFPFLDLLPFGAAALASNGGYLAATSTFDWQTTLMKPHDGVGALFTQGFADALGDIVKLNSAVTEIRQSDTDVTITYMDTTTGESHQITGDYCVCNIPLSVLIKIPADFSGDFRAAIMGIPYDMSCRSALGFKRRFWEQDDLIYGGQSFSNIPGIGIYDYPDTDYFAPNGVMLGSYNFGNNAAKFSILSLADRAEFMLSALDKIHPQGRADFTSAFSVAWHRMPYSLGAWPAFTDRTRTQFYPRLLEPDGRVYLVGEHLSYVNAWLEGAFQAAWYQLEKLHSRVQQGG